MTIAGITRRALRVRMGGNGCEEQEGEDQEEETVGGVGVEVW